MAAGNVALQVLVTEMLLSRTRAEAVEPVALQLFARLPTPEQLADADIEVIASLLRPLGLHQEARSYDCFVCSRSRRATRRLRAAGIARIA